MNLILCPLKKEWLLTEAALASLDIEAPRHQQKGRWHLEIPKWKSLCCVGGLGKDKFSEQTQYWIDQFPDLQWIITLGSAGSLSDDVKVGDVLAVTEIADWQDESTAPIIYQTQTSALIKDKDSAKIKTGRLFAADENVTSKERRNLIHKQTRALAVSWESLGGLLCAQNNNITYAEFRAITDSADAQTPKDFEKSLEGALLNAVKQLDHFLA